MRGQEAGVGGRFADAPAPEDGGWAVPFQRPVLPPAADIERYFRESRDAGWYSNGGPCHDRLVDRASALLDDRIVVPMSSAGLGLVLALRALTGEPAAGRREVILPSFTFAACAAAVVWSGLEPVFCDVEDRGWHLCPDRLREALQAREGRVAAVLACSTFGTPPPPRQVEAWAAAAGEAGVPLLVDSAAGLGSCAASGLADAEIYSMHATKPLPIGEGGLVAVHDPQVAETLRLLANHGLDADHRAVLVGLNAKLDEWHCAAALAGMDRLDETLAARRSRAAALRRETGGCDIAFQRRAEDSAVQFVPVLMASAEARDRLLDAGRSEGVEMRTYFDRPLDTMPAYEHRDRAGDLEVTRSLAARIVSLPMATDLSPSELDRVAQCVQMCG